MAATTPATTKTVPKKTKASKEKKPTAAKASSHPPYFQMIKEALLALKEKGGSSPHAIAKYLEETHKAVLPANFKKILGLQLKNSAIKGKLVKVKASYKLSEAGKKEATKGAAEKKPKSAKTAAPKAKAVKKVEPKKKPVKKATVGKTKPKAKATPVKRKAPKSIKSPAAKKAKTAKKA